MTGQTITPCGQSNQIVRRWALFLACLLAAGAQPAHGAGVVGTGTPESCTEAALDAALAGGGRVTFDCGAEPVTITLTAEELIGEEMGETTVDGGGLVTLSGGGSTRVFAVSPGAILNVENLTIANGASHATMGGGIYNMGALTVTDSTLLGNGAAGGGAIYNVGTLRVMGTLITGNSAQCGAGIFNDDAALTIANSTVAKNTITATDADECARGGGVYGCGDVRMTNSTVSENKDATGANAGILVTGIPRVCFGQLTIVNTLVADSIAGNCDAVASGHNLIESDESSCGLVNGVNGNIVGVDPLLDSAGLADNGGPTQTIALQPDSPAIDAGDPEACATAPVDGLDQRGYVRPGVGHTQCSIGAYEADAIPVSDCVGDCDGDGMVAVDELILGVDIALGEQPVGACPAFRNSDGMVDIAQLITGVNNALDGCAAG